MSKLTFGKYDGESMLEVAALDPEYVMWAFENTKQDVSPEAYAKAIQVLEGETPDWDWTDTEPFQDAAEGW